MKDLSRGFLTMRIWSAFGVLSIISAGAIGFNSTRIQDQKKGGGGSAQSDLGKKVTQGLQDLLKRQQEKQKPDAPPTREEQAILKKEGVPVEDQVGFLRWLRAGRPSFDMDEAKFAKNFPLPAVPKSTQIGCFANGDLESNTFQNWSLYTLQSQWVTEHNWFTGGTYTFCPDGGNWQYAAIPSPNPATLGPDSQHAILPAAGSGWTNQGYHFYNAQSIPDASLNWNTAEDPLMAIKPGAHLKKPFPNGGTRVLRLGNPDGTGSGGGAVWWFKVTPETQDFGFRYAWALEYSIWGVDARDHQTYEQARFSFSLIDPNGSTFGGFSSTQPPMFITGFQDIASPTGNNAGPGRWVWKGPTCYRTHIPDRYLGRWVMARFEARDCPFGRPGGPGTGIAGHAGYAYVDSVCDDSVGSPVIDMEKDEYCDNERIMVDGSPTDPATSHTWSLQETDRLGNPVDPSTLVSVTQSGDVGAAFDLMTWYRNKGKRFKCGHYYTLTLSAATTCGGEPAKRTFYVECCQGTQNCCENPPTIGAADLSTTMTAGSYRFSPTMGYATNRIQITKVEMDLIESEVMSTPDKCGYTGPVFSYYSEGASPQGFKPPRIVAQPYGRSISFASPGVSLVNTQFPVVISFPPPSTDTRCTEYLHFAIRYRFTDTNCKSCEIIKHYYFRRGHPGEGGLEPTPTPIDALHWPATLTDIRKKK